MQFRIYRSTTSFQCLHLQDSQGTPSVWNLSNGKSSPASTRVTCEVWRKQSSVDLPYLPDRSDHKSRLASPNLFLTDLATSLFFGNLFWEIHRPPAIIWNSPQLRRNYVKNQSGKVTDFGQDSANFFRNRKQIRDVLKILNNTSGSTNL